MKNVVRDTAPSAYVTKNKQRIKQFENTVYLNNGDEFEIELFNPTQNKILAKIELNGHSIGSGIVLRPAERVFLERYLDVARKFLFETYKVQGDSSEMEKAIEKNGTVSVKFYNEQLPLPITNWGTTFIQQFPSYTPTPCSFPPRPFYGDVNVFNSSCISNLQAPNTTLTSSISSSGLGFKDLQSMVKKDKKIKSRSVSMDNLETSFSSYESEIEYSDEIETGRVEKGSNSNQNFTYDSSVFYSWASWTTEWKILPLSQKIVVKEDLVIYCGECGAKRKKETFKFCPSCGTKY